MVEGNKTFKSNGTVYQFGRHIGTKKQHSIENMHLSH